MHPIIVSRITDSVLSKKAVVPLSEVIDNKEVYRVRFSVVASSSTEYAKCVKIQDKTGALTPATPKKGQKLVTYLQFLVKDTETLATNQLTRVNLIDNGVFFSGIQAADLQDKSKSAQLEEVVSTLERFNVWIEASVKLVNGQIVIADTTALKKFD